MALLNQTQNEYYEGDNYGSYQFVTLQDIIDQFMVVYVGEDKIIEKAKRFDVAFHAQRALAELSFDTFKSVKSQEITLPPSLTMILPHDYVNYTKISVTDESGIKHPLYPTKNTSNPTPIFQNDDGTYHIKAKGTLTSGSDQLVLNDKYDNILVGMVISGGVGDVEGNVVKATSVSGGITTVTMDNASTLTITAFANFEFKNKLDLILETETQVNVTSSGMTVIAGTNFIAGIDATELSDVKKGMLVSSNLFPIGTIVTDVIASAGQVFTNSDALSNGSPTSIVFTSTTNNSTTWTSYKNHEPKENTLKDYDYDDQIYEQNVGQRYGLSPQEAQINGSYFIDDNRGLIYFSSNLNGKNIVLDYISDGLGTEEEMKVHKFAEEAMYRSIAYGLVAGSKYLQPLVQRYKREKFAAVRQAKLRLSNIKLTELVQIMRNKSKHIKH